ncbi:unnamed protein product [Allacma fusca]|uniref:Uncharacterized protein n=1 Tax=Allacma fusca TaxID=39272 RepID=A0A8J2KHR4_9HEXA|nr:unnamed protein product [Allacma fusca]
MGRGKQIIFFSSLRDKNSPINDSFLLGHEQIPQKSIKTTSCMDLLPPSPSPRVLSRMLHTPITDHSSRGVPTQIQAL